MNRIAKLGICIALTIGLAGISTSALAETIGPDAEISVTNPNYTTVPTVFTAMNSGGGDYRGYLFEFDVDGSGNWSPKTDNPIIDHTFDKPGDYTASVRVTDEVGRTSVATVAVSVADVLDLGKPFVPAPGQPTDVSAAVDKNHVLPGDSLKLSVSDLENGEQYQVGLGVDSENAAVAITLGESLAGYGPFESDTASIKMPKDIKPGKYMLLVKTSTLRINEQHIVVDPAPAGQAGSVGSTGAISGYLTGDTTSWVAPSALALLATAGATATIVIRRRKKTPKL